jgi:hypothetical protein
MLVLVSADSVGVSGLPGVDAGIISMKFEGALRPIALIEYTINLYLRPAVKPEVR